MIGKAKKLEQMIGEWEGVISEGMDG